MKQENPIKKIVKEIKKSLLFENVSIALTLTAFITLQIIGYEKELSSTENSGILNNEVIILAQELIKRYKGENNCFAIDPIQGIYVEASCSKEKHSYFKTKVIPFNDTLAITMARNRYQRFIIPTIKTTFFMPNGMPLLFYYRYPDNRIELLSYYGYHPIFNEKLKPITKDVAAEIIDNLQNQNLDFFVKVNDFKMTRNDSIIKYDYLKRHIELLKSL